MIRLGLTGSIGMGKTTTAGLFAEMGAFVYDADAAVHALYAAGGAGAEALASDFPDAVIGGIVDRPALAARIKADPPALARLEAIVHPLIAASRDSQLAAAEAFGAQVAVLDVPLLFETGGDAAVDAVVVATAPSAVQRARVLARPGMDLETFLRLSARQLSDADKLARADFQVHTDGGVEAARRQVRTILDTVLEAGWRSARG